METKNGIITDSLLGTLITIVAPTGGDFSTISAWGNNVFPEIQLTNAIKCIVKNNHCMSLTSNKASVDISDTNGTSNVITGDTIDGCLSQYTP